MTSEACERLVLPGALIKRDGVGRLDDGTSQVDAEKTNRLGDFAIGIERFNADAVKTAVTAAMRGTKVEVAGDKRA